MTLTDSLDDERIATTASSADTATMTRSSHPHRGKVTPFQPGDPKIKLPPEALLVLRDGKPWQTQIQDNIHARGLVVQDVRAPTNIVWERILDFDRYADMVPNTLESENYRIEPPSSSSPRRKKTRKASQKEQTFYTRMKIGFPLMVTLQFFVKQNYQPELNSLTWTLDYDQKSDVDDSCGYWYVMEHPDNPDEWCRVFYSVEASLFDWVPAFVVNFMKAKALTDATGWVKKFSELEVEKLGGIKKAVRKKRKGGWLKRAMSRRTDGAERTARDQEEESTCASTESGDSSCVDAVTASLADTKQGEEELEPVGLKRYALITTVILLSIYNLHLYFSQKSLKV